MSTKKDAKWIQDSKIAGAWKRVLGGKTIAQVCPAGGSKAGKFYVVLNGIAIRGVYYDSADVAKNAATYGLARKSLKTQDVFDSYVARMTKEHVLNASILDINGYVIDVMVMDETPAPGFANVERSEVVSFDVLKNWANGRGVIVELQIPPRDEYHGPNGLAVVNIATREL